MSVGGNWDIRGLVHDRYWTWIVGFVVVYVLSGVLVYFKLRRPRDKSAANRKSA
jgi:putative exporter of polyketide antibiotics